jgi:two-component system chemotaxis response regulator CheY
MDEAAPKAMVVDDSRSIRMILKRMLGGLGFDVIEAENGKQALDQLHADPDVSIMLVDWNMPEMNGLELVNAVRADPDLKDVWIMMVTSETETTLMALALASGADEYVLKPFDQEAIVDKLELLGLVDEASQ